MARHRMVGRPASRSADQPAGGKHTARLATAAPTPMRFSGRPLLPLPREDARVVRHVQALVGSFCCCALASAPALVLWPLSRGPSWSSTPSDPLASALP